MALIEIQHLTKVFGTGADRVTALEDVSLRVEDGDIFGIIGMSGAGKSTLLRCLSMLEKPTSGQIVLDGSDLAAMNGAQLRAERRKMGVVFQGYNLLMQKTVAENVAFPLKLEAAGGHRPGSGHKARDFIVRRTHQRAGPSDHQGHAGAAGGHQPQAGRHHPHHHPRTQRGPAHLRPGSRHLRRPCGRDGNGVSGV